MNKEQITESQVFDDREINEGIKLNYGICECLYHGTSKPQAQKIERTSKIIIPDNVNYLGKGFYCYYWDIEASRIWARKKNNTEKIAVLKLVVHLGNTFFIDKELYQIFRDKAKTLEGTNLSIDKKVGNYIELFIKEFIKTKYSIDIHTVARYYILRYNKIIEGDKKSLRRCVLMYSLRNEERVKDIRICWEEE
ncbi:MAG: hypothetical protein JW770_01145 [Actinobacteria bacterium]|nr:hypothetical protein [Actinomycetota bacterium]